MRYVALVRGINVGGKATIPMAKLKTTFERCGLTNVSTFIASGNVLFDAQRAPKLDAKLTELLGLPIRLTLRTAQEMAAIVEDAPRGFGAKPNEYRYDVWFLIPPLTTTEAIAVLRPREGVDRVVPGNGVIYTTRLVAKATQSRLSRVVRTPIYEDLTIRNWNTTRQVAELMSGAKPLPRPTSVRHRAPQAEMRRDKRTA